MQAQRHKVFLNMGQVVADFVEKELFINLLITDTSHF